MQQNHYFPKAGAQYPLVALGTALLALVVIAAAHSTLATLSLDRFIADLHLVAGIFDARVAVLMSTASMVILSGLWKAAPATHGGSWSLRIAVALLVAVNWAAWVVALWWH